MQDSSVVPCIVDGSVASASGESSEGAGDGSESDLHSCIESCGRCMESELPSAHDYFAEDAAMQAARDILVRASAVLKQA